MPGPEPPAVEVAYALPDRQFLVRVGLAEGMTALAAVEASGLHELRKELAGRSLDLGIFGQPVPSDRLLKNGDRVEIYRALKADPREARRRLAAQGRTMGSAAAARRR
jgi:putative ubiquitin-RnfH superfamily antitoxin RatB of RatAB toxin-antitoxin module